MIRTANPGDIPALISLERVSPDAAHWTEEQYRQILQQTDVIVQRLILVIDDSNSELCSNCGLTVAGFLVAQHIAPDWELENIVVALQAQRTGIGHRLLAALVETATRANSEAVFLEVRESNAAARGLYQKCKFRQTGRRKSYYSNPLEDAILYRLSLR